MKVAVQHYVVSPKAPQVKKFKIIVLLQLLPVTFVTPLIKDVTAIIKVVNARYQLALRKSIF